MNELKIWIDGTKSVVYYETEEISAKKAYEEFEEICERMRINIDNLCVGELELQDDNFNIIDKIVY